MQMVIRTFLPTQDVETSYVARDLSDALERGCSLACGFCGVKVDDEVDALNSKVRWWSVQMPP